MASGIANALRLLRVARVLARHDALFLLEDLGIVPVVARLARLVSRRRAPGRPGERLARALEEAGPSFIKLGQALSTRSDLLGEPLCEDLSALQDDLPPFSGADARKAIEEEFGAPMDELFEAFDDTAVAAASIAQVHFAVTRDGREVAVKVLRPGIEERFADDMDMFRWVAELIEANVETALRFRPVASVETLAESVALEMDLRFEAAAAAELGDNFRDDPDFYVPAVDWSLTGRRVLTTERIAGLPVDDRAALIEAGLNPTDALEKAARAFFNQAFRDGFFHGDLHPGNLFVMPDGRIGAVDFGIMGRLDVRTRRHLGEMLLGFLTRDYRRVAEVHFEAGWVPKHKSVEAFTQACRAIAEPILDKPQNEISIARLLGLLFHIAQTFEMEAQPQLLLLQKTMLVAEGTSRMLDPEANMWMMARPLIEDWMRREMGPEARVRDAAADLADTLRRLPRTLAAIERGADALAGGRVSLDPATVRALRRGTRRRRWAAWLWPGAVLLAVVVALAV